MYFLYNEKIGFEKNSVYRTDDSNCVLMRIEFVGWFAILLSSRHVIEKKRIHFD